MKLALLLLFATYGRGETFVNVTCVEDQPVVALTLDGQPGDEYTHRVSVDGEIVHYREGLTGRILQAWALDVPDGTEVVSRLWRHNDRWSLAAQDTETIYCPPVFEYRGGLGI